VLHTIATKQALHQLFLDKGFVRKPSSLQAEQMVQQQRREKDARAVVSTSSYTVWSVWLKVYGTMAAVVLVVFVATRRGVRRRIRF
jgi:hypothetical protein